MSNELAETNNVVALFSNNQIDKLKENLSTDNVKTRDGTGNTKLSYLASHHVIDMANEIFGFGMWGTEIQMLQQIDKTKYDKKAYKQGDPDKPMISISYLCQLKLTVRGAGGENHYEDTGFGNGVAGDTPYGIGSCIELASKEAVTDALKRCMRYHGNQFGNSLYNKDGVGAVSPDEIALSKKVSENQLSELRTLYEERGIDDEWVLIAIKAEGYNKDDLIDMRQDWFNLAYKITRNHKLDEIKKANYEEDIKKVIKLLKESSTENMLKALYVEAFGKAKEQGDKETMKLVMDIKDELKEKLK
jgi:DNA recombination protein Rad52